METIQYAWDESLSSIVVGSKIGDFRAFVMFPVPTAELGEMLLQHVLGKECDFKKVKYTEVTEIKMEVINEYMV